MLARSTRAAFVLLVPTLLVAGSLASRAQTPPPSSGGSVPFWRNPNQPPPGSSTPAPRPPQTTSPQQQQAPPPGGSIPEAGYGGGQAFCVRLCDGRYFPLQPHPTASPSQLCSAFCPATQTRIFRGNEIQTAVGQDGSRYQELKNAYLYRKEVVSSCTCNGRDAFGLAAIDASTDPTLRPGDIVATGNGLAAYTGGNGHAAAFTPVGSYAGLPKSDRNKLSGVRISRTAPVARATAPSAGHEPDDRNAKLEK